MTKKDSTTTSIEAVRDRAKADAHQGGTGTTGTRRIEQAYQLGVADALTWVLQDGEYSRPLVELLDKLSTDEEDTWGDGITSRIELGGCQTTTAQ